MGDKHEYCDSCDKEWHRSALQPAISKELRCPQCMAVLVTQEELESEREKETPDDPLERIETWGTADTIFERGLKAAFGWGSTPDTTRNDSIIVGIARMVMAASNIKRRGETWDRKFWKAMDMVEEDGLDPRLVARSFRFLADSIEDRYEE